MSDYQGNIIIKNPAVPAGPTASGAAPGIWTLSEAMSFIKQGVWPNASILNDPYFNHVSLLLSTTSLGNANNNLFVDSSGAFNPVSRGGNVMQGTFSPYGSSWSNYFDGSGDYLTLPSNAALEISSGDFTIEAWVYKASNGNYQSIYSNWNDGNSGGVLFCINGLTPSFLWRPFNISTAMVTGPAITANTWTHVAVVRSGNVFTVYTNGVAGTPVTYSTNATAAQTYQVGAYAGGASGNFNGYLSNVRVVKGTAVYTSNFTPPTSALTAISGTSLLTCQSNRFRDASTNNFTLTVSGNPSVQDFSPFPPAYPGITYNQNDITNWSGYFDGNGDYLTVPYNSSLQFPGDFTIECWVYPISRINAYPCILANYSTFTSNGGFAIFAGHNSANTARYNVAFNGTFPAIQSSSDIIYGAWSHIALVRSGSTITLYVNGVANGTTTSSSTVTGTANNWWIATAGDALTSGAFNGQISNLRVVKDAAVYTGNFTPPTTNLTAISGTALLTLQNAAFTDNSANNFILTQNGNPTVTGNSPINASGYWSNYFDGTDDEVLAPNTPANFGSSSFTAECWVMFSSNTAGYQMIMGNQGTGDGQGWIMYTETNNQLTFAYSVSGGWAGSISTGITPSVGVWTHLAVVRNGNTITFYVNGTAAGTPITTSSAIQSPTGNFRIGRYPYFPGGARTINAHISNVRLVNGTAVYTSNFTPSTAPLTAIANTSLLTCQSNRFIDSSSNGHTITLGGNPSVQSFDPFYTSTISGNGGSMYFGSTNTGALETILNVPASNTIDIGAGDFTAECWVYMTSAQNYSRIIQFNNTWSSSGATALIYARTDTQKFAVAAYDFGVTLINANSTYVLNTWYHIAVTRVGNVFSMYINGVKQSETYSTSSRLWSTTTPFMSIGNGPTSSGGFSPTQGYVADVRIVKGSAVYTANFTPPTAPLTPTGTTCLLVNGMNAGIYDATTINDMETVGNAQVTTAVSKFGGSSMYFDGSGDYLTRPNSDLNNLGTGNFTIELWFKSNTGSMNTHACLVASYSNPASGSWAFKAQSGNTGYIQFASYGPSWNDWVTTTNIASDQQWHHCAVTRSGNTLRIFVDGVVAGTWDISSASSFTGGGHPLTVGFMAQDSTSYLNGYIDDLRITRGIARYTSNFTPPDRAFPIY